MTPMNHPWWFPLKGDFWVSSAKNKEHKELVQLTHLCSCQSNVEEMLGCFWDRGKVSPYQQAKACVCVCVRFAKHELHMIVWNCAV